VRAERRAARRSATPSVGQSASSTRATCGPLHPAVRSRGTPSKRLPHKHLRKRRFKKGFATRPGPSETITFWNGGRASHHRLTGAGHTCLTHYQLCGGHEGFPGCPCPRNGPVSVIALRSYPAIAVPCCSVLPRVNVQFHTLSATIIGLWPQLPARIAARRLSAGLR
jgi:hypothetical protein